MIFSKDDDVKKQVTVALTDYEIVEILHTEFEGRLKKLGWTQTTN